MIDRLDRWDKKIILVLMKGWCMMMQNWLRLGWRIYEMKKVEVLL